MMNKAEKQQNKQLACLALQCGTAVIYAMTKTILCGRDKPVSFTGTVVRETARYLMRGKAGENGALIRLSADIVKRERPWKVPKGYTLENYALSASSLELLKTNSKYAHRLVYQLHGGGYLVGLSNIYRKNAVRYSRCASGATVASLDYRTAPAAVYPAALEDALEGWKFLQSLGYTPENIIVAGDSAGGNLALALTAKLRDDGERLPAAIVCMSAWTDLAGEGESYVRNKHTDPLFGIEKKTKNLWIPLLLDYAGSTDLKDKYLSPKYGEFNDFPPMLLQVGTQEILESDTEVVYEKARTQGVDVRMTKYQGMFHVFQMAGTAFPESKAAWVEVMHFLNIHFKPKR